MTAVPTVDVPATRPRPPQLATFIVVLAAVSWALGAFAAWPWAAEDPGTARLRISFKHVTRPVSGGSTLSAEDLAKLPAHMRPRDGARTASGRRGDARLTVELDGHTVLARTYRPTGLRHDGPVHAYEEVPVRPGRHRLTVTLAGESAGDRHVLAREVDVRPGRAPLLELVSGGDWRFER
jgi:hypothetical protein